MSNTEEIHRRQIGNTRTLLFATLKQPDESGTLQAINLTGLTVKFRMVNAATGADKIAETTTGVTVETAASGTVKYDFSAAGVDTAGVYWGYFTVYSGSEYDTVPVRARDLKIVIDSATQTGEQVYEAAIAA